MRLRPDLPHSEAQLPIHSAVPIWSRGREGSAPEAGGGVASVSRSWGEREPGLSDFPARAQAAPPPGRPFPFSASPKPQHPLPQPAPSSRPRRSPHLHALLASPAGGRARETFRAPRQRGATRAGTRASRPRVPYSRREPGPGGAAPGHPRQEGARLRSRAGAPAPAAALNFGVQGRGAGSPGPPRPVPSRCALKCPSGTGGPRDSRALPVLSLNALPHPGRGSPRPASRTPARKVAYLRIPQRPAASNSIPSRPAGAPPLRPGAVSAAPYSSARRPSCVPAPGVLQLPAPPARRGGTGPRPRAGG